MVFVFDECVQWKSSMYFINFIERFFNSETINTIYEWEMNEKHYAYKYMHLNKCINEIFIIWKTEPHCDNPTHQERTMNYSRKFVWHLGFWAYSGFKPM